MTNPHETPFRYDAALVASCASSPPMAARRRRWEEEGGVGAEAEGDRPPGRPRDCRALFDAHAAHYRRPPPSEAEELFWDAFATEEVAGEGASRRGEGGRDAGSTLEGLDELEGSPRVEAFLSSVAFVHDHNGQESNHRVTLNRFSDVPSHELPLMSAANNGDTSSADASLDAGFDRWKSALEGSLRQTGVTGERSMFVPLDEEASMVELGNLMRRRRRRPQQQREDPTSTNQNSKGQLSSRSYVSNLFGDMRDSWWWVGGGHRHGDKDSKKRAEEHAPKPSHSKGNSFLVDKHNKHKLGGLEEKSDSTTSDGDDVGDRWDRHLNWATEDNPDGVPIVHPAIDQGSCGSCWAVSATGTLEASIARNVAYVAYEDAYASVAEETGSRSRRTSKKREGSGGKSGVDPRLFAVAEAQRVERRAILAADLSVQELIDCDTRYDQGCAGGNPLLAFYFLHRYGITSTENYPYSGVASSCKYRKVDQPVATVESWGILTPDHENNMEKVLRYVGPVAVGLIGADPAFLGYEGGVFVSTGGKGGKCDVGQADHAMLITGYGEEVGEDGTVERYWIARNSWGVGWGENGFVRVARRGGKKGHRGVCGIARSPSVALGGIFTKDVRLEKYGVYGRPRGDAGGDAAAPHDGIQDEASDGSANVRASSEIRNVFHRIRARIGFVQKGIMMSTLDGEEHGGFDAAVPFAAAGGMVAVCLLFALAKTYRLRRIGRNQQQQNILRQPSGEDGSVATNWSTMGVCDGAREDVSFFRSFASEGSIDRASGERIRLLENSPGSLYT
ncbi:hypothetical protein ACHAWF_019057 [Thalassiosira exigua]